MVVLDKLHYTEICLKLLINRTWYKRISPLIIETYVKKYYHILDKNGINKETWGYICNLNPRTPTFYCLSKTHKKNVDITGIPIVSGNGSLTENCSRYVDVFLRPHETLSYKL